MSQTTPRPSLPLTGRLTLAWLRCYTAGLSMPTRDDRRDEVTGDLWDQTIDVGSGPSASRAIARRMLLGVPADLSWRTEQARRHRRAARERVAMIELTTTRRRIVATSLVIGVLQVALIGVLLAVAFFTWSFFENSVAGQTLTLIAFLGVLLGLWGVVSLIRTRRVGSGSLAFAALLMSVPFYWSPLMTALSIGFGTVHLLAFMLVRDGAEHAAASTEAGATAL